MLLDIHEKFFDKYGKYIYPAIPGIFFVLIFINNYSWILMDKSMPISDSPLHLEIGRRYYHILNSGNIKAIFDYPNEYYPNLTYQLTAIFQRIFGFTDDMAVLSQFPFWLILIYSTYFIGLKLFGEKAGAIASIASFSSPFIIRTSQCYLLDIPSAAMTAFSLVCLFYSDNFRKQGWTLAFFIGLALAMMTKWSSAFFIAIPFVLCFSVFIRRLAKEKFLSLHFIASLIVPLCYAAGRLFWNYHHLRRFVIIGGNLFTLYLADIAVYVFMFIVISMINFKEKTQKRFLQGIVLFYIIIWHFYGLNIFNIYNFMTMQSEVAVNRGDINSPLSLFFGYFLTVIGIPGLFLLLIGFIWFLVDKDGSFDRKLFLWGFAGSMFILFLIPIKDTRYFIPLIPFTAILKTFWIFRIQKKYLRIAVLSLFILISVMGIIGWRIPFLRNISVHTPLSGIIKSSLALPPDENDWKLEKIEETIHKYSTGKNTIILGIFEFNVDTRFFSGSIISKYSRFNSHILIMPGTIGGKPGDRVRNIKQQEGYSYHFALTPPLNEEEYTHKYDNLLILFFRKNYGKLDETTYLDYFLLERNFTGKPVIKEKIELPENITIYIMEMKVDPPLDWGENH